MSKGTAAHKINEETNALMSNGPARSVPEKGGFGKFLYNKEKGTCLGRTGSSWFKIFVFYVIFYACLAAFWIALLSAFLNTVDPALPRFYGKGTIIGASPGVGYKPWIKENPGSTLIKFNPKDPSSYAQYVKVLDAYYAGYENTNDTRFCQDKDSNSQVVKDGKLVETDGAAPCRFNLKPFDRAGCLQSTDYGFKSGTPCVVLSLNRLIGWKPENYATGEVPAEVMRRYRAGNIAFNCGGTHDIDKEIEGSIEYVPQEGIDGRFYPYAVMKNYHQPIALVKFRSLPANRVVMIECRAYAKNIEHSVNEGVGIVNFELMRIEAAAPTPSTKSS